MRTRALLLLTSILITACAPATQPATIPPEAPVTSPPQTDVSTMEPMNNPFAPQPRDSALVRGNVLIEESGLLIRESYPPQISLGMSGNLPTPCHELRLEIETPDAQNKIEVSAYTVVDPNIMCTQVLKPFSERVDLGTFASGHYSVWVNDQPVGEFDS